MHGSKKRAPAGIREAKVEVDKEELCKLISVGTELAKEIQEIKRNWVPRSDDKNKENKENDRNKDKDKKGKKGERRRVSTRLMRRRVPLLPQPTPLSGAPAAKGPS